MAAKSPPPSSVDEASLPTTQSPGSESPEEPAKAEDQEELQPMVFLCAGCKRAVGDTLDWEANDESTRSLLLRNVSPTVTVNQEQKESSWPKEHGCMLETLFCSGCKMTLGSIYRCTPKHLDYKRDLYSLNIDCLESYTLGAAEQKADVDQEPLTFGSLVPLEELLERAETTVKELEHRISLVESAFESLPDNG